MRHILAIVSAAVLIPCIGLSQTDYNQFGIYTDWTGDTSTASVVVGVNEGFHVYLVVTNPYNEEFDDGSGVVVGRAVEFISGFECQLRWAEAGAVVYSTGMPDGGLNVGTAPDVVVGLAAPLPIISGSAALFRWSVYVTDLDPHHVFMGLTRDGYMDIFDSEDQSSPLVDMRPSSGDFSMPVFGINAEVVATEGQTWGGVKALFR